MGQFTGKLSESECQLLGKLPKKIMQALTIGFYFLYIELLGHLADRNLDLLVAESSSEGNQSLHWLICPKFSLTGHYRIRLGSLPKMTS